MAPSRNYLHGLRVGDCLLIILIILIISSFTFLSSRSVGVQFMSSNSESDRSEQQRETVLGSRPPDCVNKCMSCRPCRATLVIPPHQWRRGSTKSSSSSSSHDQDDPYYLLSWKCRCGNKLYQP